jgi:hypothetical protein
MQALDHQQQVDERQWPSVISATVASEFTAQCETSKARAPA